MALPPRQDGRADDRRQGRHGRLVGRRLPALTLFPPLFPDLWAVRSGSDRRRSPPRTCGSSPNPLAADYARFRVSERLLLSGHSHQAWPDVALEGVVECFKDAAPRRRRQVGPRVRQGRRGARRSRARCSATRPPTSRSGRTRTSSSSGSCRRSTLRAQPRLVTTDGEFHTLRAASSPRLGEAGLDVVRVEAAPADHAGRATRRRRRRPHRGGARVGRPLRDGAGRAGGLDALALACEAQRGTAARRRLPRARPRGGSRCPSSGSSRRGSRAAATSTCSSARATASCACRRRPPGCARC